MSKTPKFKENDRVNFMAWTEEVTDGVVLDTLRSFVGYIKQVRNGRLKTEYAICVAKSDEMFVVPEKDIFGIVEKKDYKSNKTKTEESGN